MHLYCRNTGVNILLDEIQIPPNLWTKSPRHVSIALTNLCDLSCPYCFVPKNASMLDFNRLIGWLDELETNGCLGVGFGGGEPTLYPKLTELCRHVSKHTNLALTLTTHGHNLDDELLCALDGNVHFIRISMDGVGNTYEALRGRPFQLLLARFAAIKSIALFGINYLINQRTLPDLSEAARIAAREGASELLLLPEQPIKGKGGINTSTAQKLRNWVRHYRGKVPLSVSEIGAQGLPICYPHSREAGLYDYVHIDANGILKNSSFDSAGVEVGVNGLMHALDKLRTFYRENENESMA